jgi:hypothetical protein
MDDLFEEVLAICLDRLSDGDTIESCVADFPECPDLRPLLEIAAALSTESRTDRGRDACTPTWLRPRADHIRLRPTG